MKLFFCICFIGILYLEKEDDACKPDTIDKKEEKISEEESDDSSFDGTIKQDTDARGLCCWSQNHTDRLLFQILGIQNWIFK